MARQKEVICICGLAGSGKSTLAKKVAENYALRYCSGGDALKAIALEQGYKPLERGWWESAEGLRFLRTRGTNPLYDKEVDGRLLRMAKQGNVVLDSWTMPWLLERAFKIWLEASPETRGKRIAKRDGLSYDLALTSLEIKEKKTKEIYQQLYGFKLGEDLDPFHFILDTNNLRASEVFSVLCSVIDSLCFRSSRFSAEN